MASSPDATCRLRPLSGGPFTGTMCCFHSCLLAGVGPGTEEHRDHPQTSPTASCQGAMFSSWSGNDFGSNLRKITHKVSPSLEGTGEGQAQPCCSPVKRKLPHWAGRSGKAWAGAGLSPMHEASGLGGTVGPAPALQVVTWPWTAPPRQLLEATVTVSRWKLEQAPLTSTHCCVSSSRSHGPASQSPPMPRHRYDNLSFPNCQDCHLPVPSLGAPLPVYSCQLVPFPTQDQREQPASQAGLGGQRDPRPLPWHLCVSWGGSLDVQGHPAEDAWIPKPKVSQNHPARGFLVGPGIPAWENLWDWQQPGQRPGQAHAAEDTPRGSQQKPLQPL